MISWIGETSLLFSNAPEYFTMPKDTLGTRPASFPEDLEVMDSARLCSQDYVSHLYKQGNWQLRLSNTFIHPKRAYIYFLNFDFFYHLSTFICINICITVVCSLQTNSIVAL